MKFALGLLVVISLYVSFMAGLFVGERLDYRAIYNFDCRWGMYET